MIKPILVVILLAACAKQAPIVIKTTCPQVPECVHPNLPLETNADLIRAYQATDSALAQCKIARDTLAVCLKMKDKYVAPN